MLCRVGNPGCCRPPFLEIKFDGLHIRRGTGCWLSRMVIYRREALLREGGRNDLVWPVDHKLLRNEQTGDVEDREFEPLDPSGKFVVALEQDDFIFVPCSEVRAQSANVSIIMAA